MLFRSVNAISNAQIEEIDFIARNTYNPAWKGPNYGQNYQKPYNPAGAPNNSSYNNGANNGNHETLEETLKSFINSQIEQNCAFYKMVENHDNILGQQTQKIGTIRTDLQVLQERTKIVKTQMAKIAESQTLIVAKFAGKAEPYLLVDMKMMRSTEDAPEELDYSRSEERRVGKEC